MHVCFVQYGDFADALARRGRGEPETYRAQDYAVGWIEGLARRCGNLTILSLGVPTPYEQSLDEMTLIGLAERGHDEGPRAILARLSELRPSHVVLRTPIHDVLAWAIRHGVRVLPLFADSFAQPAGYRPRALRAQHRARRLAARLNDDGIDTVANHGYAACADLVRIGVDRNKVIAWDWPPGREPAELPPKTLRLREGPRRFDLIYVGEVSRPKGVGDLVEAMGDDWMQRCASLRVIGDGPMRALLRAGAPADADIAFLGRRPNAEVFERMRAADLVIVPSRHAYSEGLPCTIYEALAARTPVVVSDHPMFKAALADGEGVIFAPEADPDGLTDAIRRALTDEATYGRLSQTTEAAFDRIRCPNLFHEVIEAWLADDPDGWLAARRGQPANQDALPMGGTRQACRGKDEEVHILSLRSVRTAQARRGGASDIGDAALR